LHGIIGVAEFNNEWGPGCSCFTGHLIPESEPKWHCLGKKDGEDEHAMGRTRSHPPYSYSPRPGILPPWLFLVPWLTFDLHLGYYMSKPQ
jgi:hypothetical protein